MSKAFKERWLSKKLGAFLLSSALLWMGVIKPDIWQAVALAYLGSQGIVDAIKYALANAPKAPQALHPVVEVVSTATGAAAPTAAPDA
tara:strand:+ start:7080 stop:7343 length:264 start_codon:yes stop_codon:yes gene_type:complete